MQYHPHASSESLKSPNKLTRKQHGEAGLRACAEVLPAQSSQFWLWYLDCVFAAPFGGHLTAVGSPVAGDIQTSVAMSSLARAKEQVAQRFGNSEVARRAAEQTLSMREARMRAGQTTDVDTMFQFEVGVAAARGNTIRRGDGR